MKYGICLPVSSAYEVGLLDGLKKLGYTYIEFQASSVAALEFNEYERFVDNVEACGMAFSVMNVFIPSGLRVVGDDANLPGVMEYAKHCFERMAELDARVIVFGSGGARNIPQGFPTRKAREQFLQTLCVVSDLAKPYNIKIAVEPLNKRECNFINTITEGFEFVQAANRENVGLTADFFHLHSDAELKEKLIKCGKSVFHAHIADNDGRVYPMINKPDYTPFFEGLREIGYNGLMSVEAGSEDVLGDAGVSLGLLKVLNSAPSHN